MRKKILELPIGYIVDFVIDVKKKKFNECFVTLEEINIISQLIQKRIEKSNLSVKVTEVFFRKNFNIVNGIITRTNNLQGNLKEDILDLQLKDIVYDEKFIYFSLCEIMINKLYGSIEHNCSNCSAECCGDLNVSSENPCRRFVYNFKDESQKYMRKILK